ncbi:hypothetical protein [Kordiimonas aestuarii]|uniref:hypothetical protein n=1 Tax=Kordiimonas aestuarii TaxID=1005925 RepID=UPI0021D12026|nr:hypothetical protein [Kordiimonas aestuarii]
MTKKYDSKTEQKGFWSKLATLLAPQDETVLYTTRIINKADKVEECSRAIQARHKRAAPSFDTPLSLIQNYD